jgi:hypothetical protein
LKDLGARNRHRVLAPLQSYLSFLVFFLINLPENDDGVALKAKLTTRRDAVFMVNRLRAAFVAATKCLRPFGPLRVFLEEAARTWLHGAGDLQLV